MPGPYWQLQPVRSQDFDRIVLLTQAEYDALSPPNSRVLYIITA